MDTLEYLQAVHGRADGFIAISSMAPALKHWEYKFYDPQDLEQAAEYVEMVKDSRHVYMAAAPLKDKPPTGRGSKAYVSSVYCLHADIDIFNPEAHSKHN